MGIMKKPRKMPSGSFQYLMKKHNIPIERVVPHKIWSGKDCPHKLLPHWSEFVSKIKGVSKPSVPILVLSYVVVPKERTRLPFSMLLILDMERLSSAKSSSRNPLFLRNDRKACRSSSCNDLLLEYDACGHHPLL